MQDPFQINKYILKKLKQHRVLLWLVYHTFLCLIRTLLGMRALTGCVGLLRMLELGVGEWVGRADKGERNSSRLAAELGTWFWAWSHNPEMMTWAQSKSQMLNQLGHPGASPSLTLHGNNLSKKQRNFQGGRLLLLQKIRDLLKLHTIFKGRRMNVMF